MIEQLTIQNFRCFSLLNVSGLKRINVLVGSNGSGKTAFLESLFMVSGAAAPQVAFQLRALRQLGSQIQVSNEPNIFGTLWGDLFHWFDQDKTISIEAIGSHGDSRALRILYSTSATQTIPFGQQPVGGSFLPQIIFEWRRGNENPIVVTPRITAGGLQFENASLEHFPVVMFAPHAADTPEENAKRFSELSKSGRISPIVEALRAEYAFIRDLSIEYNANNPTVFATLGEGKKKMPVALVSDGINKLLSILLGIGTFSRGVVLIDEIENGFYYDRFESIWRIIYSFAKLNDVQIFATSHSQECLRAMIPTLQSDAKDFCLLRAERKTGDGDTNVARFDGGQLLSALSKNGEIR